MFLQSRITDIGVGSCRKDRQYVTVFITGEKTIHDDDREVCTIDSIGITSHGHATIALTGSKTVLHNEKGAHRVNDVGTCDGPYVSVSGGKEIYLD